MAILRWRRRSPDICRDPEPTRVVTARHDQSYVLADHPKAYAEKLDGGLFWIIRSPRLVQWTRPDILLGSGMLEADAWRDAASRIAQQRAYKRLMEAQRLDCDEEGEPRRA